MALVSLKCPSCGGNIQMDDAKEKGFCMYCGTSFLVKDEIQRVQVEHSGTVNFNLNSEREIKNLLIRAEQKIAEYREISNYYLNPREIELSKVIKDYLEKILDLDPNNEKVKALKQDIVKADDNRKRKQQIIIDKDQKEKYIIIALVVGVIIFLVWVFNHPGLFNR